MGIPISGVKYFGFRGRLPPTYDILSIFPPKGTSLRDNTSFEPLIVKIDQAVRAVDSWKNLKMDRYHGMHGSACKVLRATCSVDGKHCFLDPCPPKTI